MKEPNVVNKDIPRVFLVVQPSVSHYRESFVRLLLESPDLEFILLGKYQVPRSSVVANHVVDARRDVLSKIYPIRDVRLGGAFKWQRGVVSRTVRENADIYVYEGSPYNLSTWVSIVLARSKGRKVALWGHGWKREDKSVKLAIRKFFYRIVSGHLIYGDWAKNYAARVGLDAGRFHPVYNSIYSETVIGGSPLRRLNPPGSAEGSSALRLIFSGRLSARHEVDIAVRAVTTLIDQGLDVRLVVVGEGDESGRLKEMAANYSQIEFLGGIYDVEMHRELYASSHFSVSPGASGLNVIQAMSFGVPVIAARDHYDSGPEIEAVKDGETGILFTSGSAEALAAAIRSAASMDADVYTGLSVAAHASVLQKYTAERHAEAVVESTRRMVLNSD